MEIKKDFLTINEFSRPGKKLKEVLAVVMHWTANPGAAAKENRDYFEAKKAGMGGYGSAHYIVGIKGEIIHCIPEDEVAYHCGTSRTDPASGRIYTDYARQKFGKYALETSSPNLCTIGIELCPVDLYGNFTASTVESAAELCAGICKRHGLAAQDITTHHNIVGWKDCPRLWTNRPGLLEEFKESVQKKINA